MADATRHEKLFPTQSRLQTAVLAQRQLHIFAGASWTIKSIEPLRRECFGIMLSYLTLFALDGVTDTPGWVRLAIFLMAVGIVIVPTCIVIRTPARARDTRRTARDKFRIHRLVSRIRAAASPG